MSFIVRATPYIFWMCIVLVLCLCSCTTQSIDGIVPGSSDQPALLESELHQALHKEFQRLGIDPKKTPAAAPQGAANAVFNLDAVPYDPDGPGGNPPTGAHLSWTERVIGDYDQNGEVNFADLTGLGQSFGYYVSYDPPGSHDGVAWWPVGSPMSGGGAEFFEPPSPGSGANNWRLARVDGDSNGELNFADVTPIASHWQERLDGYRIYRKGPGETEFTVLPNFNDAALPYSVDRFIMHPAWPVMYFYEDTTAAPGVSQYYVAPYDAANSSEGPPSDILEFDYTAEVPGAPVANLTASPLAGDAPLEVTYDASGSSDPDGTIVRYEWDPLGIGTYSVDTGSVPQYTTIWATAGTYDTHVRVTDNDGKQSVASFGVVVLPGWRTMTLDSDGDVGTWSSLVMTGINDPTVAYYEETPGRNRLKLIQAQDSFGGSWSQPHSIVTGEQVGIGTSLYLFGTHLGVSYTDAASTRTMYMASVGTDYTSWTGPFEVFDDGLANTQLFSSGGNPAVMYWNPALNTMHFDPAADASGTSWPDSYLINGTTLTGGLGFSGAVIEGHPAVAFWDFAAGTVGYNRADNPDGSSWGPDVAIDTGGSVGSGVSLAEIDGRPAVSYTDYGLAKILYCRATDSAGSVWGTPQVVASLDTDSGHTALVEESGLPWVFFWNRGSGLQFTSGVSAEGTSWLPVEILDSSANAGQFISALSPWDDYICLSYYDGDAGDLKFAVYY